MGGSLNHLEFVIVTKPFTREEMDTYDPYWAHSIHYAAPGEVLVVDQTPARRAISVGWQSAWTTNVNDHRLVWIHPRTLGRLSVGVQALGLMKLNNVHGNYNAEALNERYKGTFHYDVRNMAGKIPDISDHCGVCRAVLERKLYSGGLIQCVAAAIQALYKADKPATKLCFLCDWGKHRSLCARTIVALLCGLCYEDWHVSCQSRKRCQCGAGCAPMRVEDVRNMLDQYFARF